MNQEEKEISAKEAELDAQVLAALPEGNDMQLGTLHKNVNALRAENSKLARVHLGWIAGVTEKRLAASLDRLLSDGRISKDTRKAMADVFLGMTELMDVDHYRLEKNGKKKGTQMSA